ncbi:MAG: hypothetical protein IKN85_07335 [Oscillospiraceae bacterium]|nr:hypothetical protein [Oscillospiraceae bacterium]
MLSKVLKKEVCAECRFCCSFRTQSLWELPKLSAQFMEKYKTKSDGSEIRYIVSEKGDGVTDLRDCYQTDDPSEEVPCPFSMFRRAVSFRPKTSRLNAVHGRFA